MANKEYQMLFKLSAQMGKEFGTTFSGAQQQMNQLQREINQLNKEQGDIAAYQKQQTAVENTRRKLEDLQRQYDNIQREYQETGESSSALANKMIDKQRAIDQTNAKLQQQTQKLDEMEAELKEAGIDTANLGAEREKLGVQMEQLAKENEAAAKAAEDYGISGAQAFDAVGSALMAAGIAEGLKKIYEAYKECVSISADFEATMSTVEALSGASAEEMAALEAQAKELGATTAYTAKEAAEAMTYMGMAGWDASQMLSGMGGVINLAAASGEDLATVSDIVTDNLTAFGMAADQTARFSDVLAAAATNSNTSVSVMGETFKKAAPVAGALGYSIEDVAVATGLMANAGVKGSRAGTALSNTFTGLLEGVTLTGEAIGEVEFSALNADGTMKTFRETVEALRGQFDQLSEAEKTSNAMAIAGKQGYAGLLAVLNATSEDYNRLTDSINNCSGAAEKMAAIKLDNYNGQVTLLNSAMDALKTTIGDQFRPELTKLAKIATEVISTVQQFAEKNPTLVKSLMAITAEVTALLAIYKGYTAVKKIKNTLDQVSTVLKAAETAATVTQTAATTAETTATVGATAAQNALNASMLASPIFWIGAAIAGVTVAVIALTNAEKSEAAQVSELTAETQEQYWKLKDLQEEYETAAQTYGENSEEAAYLRWQVEELSAEYEAGKQTLSEYADEMGALAEQLGGNVEAYRNAISEIDRQEVSALALAHRLGELADNANRTVVEEEEMKRIMAELNEQFPELNLSLEKLSENQPDFMTTVENMVKQEAAARRNAASLDAMVDAYMDMADAEAKLKDQETVDNLEAVCKAAEDAEAAYFGMYGSAEGLGAILAMLTPEYRAWQDALKEKTHFEGEYENLEKQLEDATNAYNGASDSLKQYYDAQKEADEAAAAMNATLSTAQEQLAALTASYTEAYDAALESVQGQFNLWDEAKEPVAVTTDTIINSLQTQVEYWNKYHENLDKLREQTGNVEGLSEVIASFADGSSESVAAIAGMAEATPGELQKMVDSYQKVQEAQGEVSDSLADLTTEFSAKMAELQQNLEEDVAKMNLSAEAAANGKATIDAFAAEAENSYQRVYNAYAAIRQAAVAALNGGGATVTLPTGAQYAEGTENATRGVHLVGEEGPELVYFEGGETVIPAAETSSMLQSVQPVEALSAESSESSVNNEVTVNLSIHVDGNGDEVWKIHEAGEALKNQFAELMEDYMADLSRRRYH